MRYMSIPRPPAPHISTAKRQFPSKPRSSAQQSVRRELRTKAPTRRRILAARCQAEAGASVARVLIGFTVGFAIAFGTSLLFLTWMPFIVLSLGVTGSYAVMLLGGTLGGLLSAVLFARD